MANSHFNQSVREVEKFLHQISKLKQKGVKNINNDGVTNETKTAFRKESYAKAYHIALQNLDYDFLLEDESFFQLEFEETDKIPQIRYAFFQNPTDYTSYEDFLQGQLGDLYEEYTDEYREDYSQFLTELDENTPSTIIRFDVHKKGYKPLVHSFAHIHIGYKSDVRIPCNKILTPLLFAFFVIKHVYPYVWESFITNNPKVLENEKRKCDDVSTAFWSKEEQTDLFLT
ncbi:MAG: hypothetical protein RLZZ292_572 [Bacteroidota bacterium]|jgi:hypothetical protein